MSVWHYNENCTIFMTYDQMMEAIYKGDKQKKKIVAFNKKCREREKELKKQQKAKQL